MVEHLPLARRQGRGCFARWRPSSARRSGIFGISTYDFLGDGRVVCTYDENGTSRLALLDVTSGEIEALDLPYTSVGANV
jgi:hypothetical protein